MRQNPFLVAARDTPWSSSNVMPKVESIEDVMLYVMNCLFKKRYKYYYYVRMDYSFILLIKLLNDAELINKC
jgi:hypothetical protein